MADAESIHHPVAREPLAADDVRVELDHILSSPHFQASERRRAFLQFIVEEALSGRADRLKGYSIAVDVFGRDETFNSSADPVVRLEARRLRRDLDTYYVNAGSGDAVRISIPKGSYVPHFEWRDEPPVDGVSSVSTGSQRSITQFPRSLLIAAPVVAAVALATVGWLLNANNGRSVAGGGDRGPGVIVLPFKALGSSDDSRYLASGISEELIADLMRFPGFRLYTLPLNFEQNPNGELAKFGRNIGVAYVVSGGVYAKTETLHVTTKTVDAKSGRVLWSDTYDRPLIAKDLIGAQNALASQIATVVGQPYGVVGSDLNRRLAAPAVADMQSYVCVLRAYRYRRSFSRKEFDPVLRCLEEAVRRDPDYSDAWAMLGWLHVDAGRIPYAGYNTQDEYKKALQAASTAVRLEPNSILALKTLGAAYYYLGRYDDSERVMRQALAINPYDPGTLAQLGWRLAVRGKFEEGIPLLKRAIERAVNPPGWYFHLIAVDLYLKGNYEQMHEVAERADPSNSGFTQLLLAIVNGELGNRDATRDALKNLSEYEPLASDPAGYMRRHGAIEEIVEALMVGLQNARKVASVPIRLTQTPTRASVGHHDSHGHSPTRRSGFSPVAP